MQHSHCRWGMPVQAQIKSAQRASQDATQCHKPGTPAALFVLVRPERASVRFELKPRAAFTAILHGLEELGWPANVGDCPVTCPALPYASIDACQQQLLPILTVLAHS